MDHDGPSEQPTTGVNVGSAGAPVTHELQIHQFAGGDLRYTLQVNHLPTNRPVWSHSLMDVDTTGGERVHWIRPLESWLVPLVGALTAGEFKLELGKAYRWSDQLNKITGSGSLLVLTGGTSMKDGDWRLGEYSEGQEFEICWIHRVGNSDQHGGYAHVHCSKVMSSLRGTCTINTVTREGDRRSHELVPGKRPVHVPAGVFHDVLMSDGTVLFYIGNKVDDPDDYEKGWTKDGRWEPVARRLN